MSIRAISIQLGLPKNEAIIFGYLATLYYYGKVWKGTMEKLGVEAQLGSKQTVSRTLEKLIQKGLVEKSGLTIRLVNQEIMTLIGTKQFHNETDKIQHGTTQFQNGTETQEKEKNQKNKEEIKDNCKDNYSSLTKDIKSQPLQQPVYCNSSFTPPTWDEVVIYAKEKEIPLSLYKKFFAYYTANNWTLRGEVKMVNWKAALTYWYEKEKTPTTVVAHRNLHAHASDQEQAAYASEEHTEYLARKEREKQQELAQQANEKTRPCTYDEYKMNYKNESVIPAA